MAPRTTNTRRVRQSAVDTQAARDRIIDALNMNYGSKPNKPATYGNVRPAPTTARQRAENAAWGNYMDAPATRGRKAASGGKVKHLIPASARKGR